MPASLGVLLASWRRPESRHELLDALRSVADPSDFHALFATALAAPASTSEMLRGDPLLLVAMLDAMLACVGVVASQHANAALRAMNQIRGPEGGLDAAVADTLLERLVSLALCSPAALLAPESIAVGVHCLLDASCSHSCAQLRLLQLLALTEAGAASLVAQTGVLTLARRHLLAPSPVRVACLSVLHAATASLDVCKAMQELAVLPRIVELLLLSTQGADDDDATTRRHVALHCLGIVSNALRERSVCQTFWRRTENIACLVSAALATSCDDEVKSSALAILLSSTASQPASIKKLFTRTMTAAVQLSALASCCDDDESSACSL